VRDEIVGERLQKFRMRRRIFGTKAVDGLDDATSEKMPPEAIDRRAGKLLVLDVRQELRKSLPPLFVAGLAAVDELWRDLLTIE
jgi:hypothetical protein